MSVGIIGYLSARGLGTMTHDLRVQLGIKHQMVPTDLPWPYMSEWMTGGEFYLEQWEVQREDLEVWRDTFGIDTILSVETGYGDNTFRWAKELGMKTILVVMWEAFNPNMPAYRNVDVYVCPSFRCYQEVPFDNKLYLPYPVDTELFKYRQRTGPAKLFVHNAGSGGMNGRKGTLEALAAYHEAVVSEPEIDLLVRSQVPLESIVPDFQRFMTRKAFRIEGSLANREDLYTDGDVLIYTSRYDGHALVSLEAMASGMPVITTNALPMKEFWRRDESELLVAIKSEEKATGLVNPHCWMNMPDVKDLAAKMIWCARNDMSRISARNRDRAELEHSWKELKPRWQKLIESQ